MGVLENSHVLRQFRARSLEIAGMKGYMNSKDRCCAVCLSPFRESDGKRKQTGGEGCVVI